MKPPFDFPFPAQTQTLPALRLHCIDQVHREILEHALRLVRIRTGLLWRNADGDGQARELRLIYGPLSWLQQEAKRSPEPYLLVPALPKGTDSSEDLPGMIWRLTAPEPRRVLSNIATDFPFQIDPSKRWVDLWVEGLAGKLEKAWPNGASLVRLPITPTGAKWGIVLSHDLDYLATTLMYRATRSYFFIKGLKSFARSGDVSLFFPAVSSALGPSLWPHEDVAHIEHELGVHSDWFFFVGHPANRSTFKQKLLNPTYDLPPSSSHAQKIIARLRKYGHPIGLHASPEAGHDPSLLHEEASILRQAVDGEVRGLRHHMGRFRWPDALQSWQREGFEYGSNFICNDFQSSLLGTSGPIPMGGRSEKFFYEMPSSWMDTVSYNYLGLTPRRIESELKARLNEAANAGRLEGLIWHNIPMGSTYDSLRVYRMILETALSQGAYVGSLASVAQHARALLSFNWGIPQYKEAEYIESR